MKPLDQSGLPPIWVVGFTGHRHLTEPEKVGRSLRSLMESLRSEIPGRLIGYSSVAIGADSLFAQTCIALDIPWIALLPRPKDDFRKDFTDSDWVKTSELLGQATRVESLPPSKNRELGYLECGMSTVEESDLMIAVWDGKSPRGTGGTAEIVAHAEHLAKPLILIDPAGREIKRERFSAEFFSDAEMNQLNGANDLSKIEFARSMQPEECVRQFFHKVDAKAARIAPRYRRLVGASVIMNALAAILVAASITFAIESKTLNVIVFLLTAAAMVAVGLIRRKGSHRRWIRNRVAAEICRSALATWDLDEVAVPIWFNQMEGFGRLAKSIRLLRLSDRDKDLIDSEQWRRNYLRERIDQQLTYFSRRRQRLRAALLSFSFGFWIFSALGVVRSIFAAFFLSEQPEALISRSFHSFLPIALPLAAGCVLSLISIFDLHRQIARSRAMVERLGKIRDQIEKAANLSSLRRAVENAENVFAAEVFEWFTLYQYPRFT